MTDEEFAKVPPPPPRFGIQMLAGSAVIVVPHKYSPNIQTQFGMRDQLDLSVVVLSGPQAGQEFVGEQILAGRLGSQLKDLIGQVALGRIALAPDAKNALGPMILADPTAEDQAAAQRWMAANPGRVGFLKTEGARVAEGRAAERAQSQPQGQPPANAAGYGYPPGYGQQSQPQGQQGQQQFTSPGGFPAPPQPITEPPF
jgi:hypothetical protein